MNTSPLEKSKSKKNPFTVPTGYFENLTNQVMVSLPDKEIEIHHRVWKKITPWIYMAAMITGLAIGLRWIVGIDANGDAVISTNKSSQHSIKPETDAITVEDVLLSSVGEYDLYEYLFENE
ncbi:MAG: hypothetical protein LBD45_08645 [Bacteroidales bacterium]|jgi:hypothetical protein|nr:hypothetical protein [Bacteroidales bacterium]